MMQLTQCVRHPYLAWAVLLGSLPLTAIAGELSPYSLPSQQRLSVEMRPWEQRITSVPTISGAYYQDFAKKAKDLTPTDRSRLERDFQGKRDQALRFGRVDEAQHYNRLAQIVNAGGNASAK